MATANRVLTFCKELLFPPRCGACQALLRWRTVAETAKQRPSLCPECQQRWESEGLETCGICAKRVRECRCMPLPMQRARCDGFCKLVYYTPQGRMPVQNRLIYRIKKREDKHIHSFFAKEFLPLIEQLEKEVALSAENAVITYLPRSREATLLHGTDQAKALATVLSEKSGIPLSSLLYRKKGSGHAQKHLTPAQRVENAKQVYGSRKGVDCKGKIVLLVDDLVTTGASVAVCTQILRRMGAKCVFAVAVASDSANKDTMPMPKRIKNAIF